MLKRTILIVLIVLAACASPGALARAQGPAAALANSLAQARAIPNSTPSQIGALTRMNADLTPLIQSVTSARMDLVAVTLAAPRNDAGIKAKVEVVRAAEVALATARADAFARLQATADRLTPDQVTALAGIGGSLGEGARLSRGGFVIPSVNNAQMRALVDMTGDLMPETQALLAARSRLAAAALRAPRDDAAISDRAAAVATVDLELGNTRARVFASLQATANKLSLDQIAALSAMGGSVALGGFTQPEPMTFSDHEGYVSLFDGTSLTGWDGNPRFWRVENGAIVGESTEQNPSGNTYITYRRLEAKDFTLKFEIKIEGTGGSGLQYRSKTGIPWLANIPANVTANVGPVNLDWMLTGPQADFWPTTQYSGQFYSENTPMRIMAWRGQVVEGAGFGRRRLMGTIGELEALGNFVKMDDWNQYTVIARGGTFIHILNGQLMAVMIDDDPESSNNQSGFFGIELEQIGRVFVRNIWVKRLR